MTDMHTSRRLLLALALCSCNPQSSESGDSAGAGTDVATETTSATDIGGASGQDPTDSSGGPTDSSSSGGEPPNPSECRVFNETTYAQWQRLIDPDHLGGVRSMVPLSNGELVLGGQDQLVQYNSSGVPTAVYTTQGTVRGLGHAPAPNEFSAVIETAEVLRLSVYDSSGETSSLTVPFESGVVAYDMPLVQDDETTVLTMVRGVEEGAGVLQFRDAELTPQLEIAVDWTLDTWAAARPTGRTFVGSLDEEVTNTTITAYDDGEAQWSHVVPVAEPDLFLHPHTLVAGSALFLLASSAAMPLRALDMEDGTLLWEDPLVVPTIVATPCGDVLTIESGERFDHLYRVGIDGPELLTQLTRPSEPHSGDASIGSLAVGPDGTLFVARYKRTIPGDHSVINLMAY